MRTALSSLMLATSICWGADFATTTITVTSADSPTALESAPGDDQEANQESASAVEHDAWADARSGRQLRWDAPLRAIQSAQSRIALAQLGDVNDNPNIQTSLDGGGFAFAGGGRSAPQPPLIIRTTDLEAATQANIQEDLSVMSRILTKTVEREAGREGHDSAMGIVISTLPGARRPQSIYLEGYGALFLLNVRFPLLAPSSKDEEKPEKAVDTTWEQTKRELYVTGDRSGPPRTWEVPGSSGAEYNAEQVESLKKELLDALKNATNIRDVKLEESITLVVMGSRPGGASRVKHVVGRKGNSNKTEIYSVADNVHAPGRESTMTFRAKKSDIDAFAKGIMDSDQFKKHVSISVY